MTSRSSSKNKVRTPWAGTDPLELGAESNRSNANSLIVTPTSLVVPKAMDRGRGKQSEAFASMASGARDRSTFDTFYHKHLRLLKGEGTSEDMGNSGTNNPPQLLSSSSASSPNTKKVVLAPISHSSPTSTSSPGQTRNVVGVVDFERSMLGALTAGVVGKVGGGKRVKGVGGVVYKGATMQSNTTNTVDDNVANGDGEDRHHHSPSQGSPSKYHISGPVPDETSSRANRLQQGAHHRSVTNTTTDQDTNNNLQSNNSYPIYHQHQNNDCSPRQKKRLHHEAAVEEGRRWEGTNVTVIPGLSPDEEANNSNINNTGSTKKGVTSMTSKPPNSRAAARLALVSRTNELAVAATKPRGKIDDDTPLVQRKQGQWASERGDAIAGFPSVWECQRHIVIPPPREDDWTVKDEDEEPPHHHHHHHSHHNTHHPPQIKNKKGPSCLPSDHDHDDDGTVKKNRAHNKRGGPHLPASHGSPPPRHDARQGRGTTKLLPPTIHPLTSSEGGRYFIAPEPTSYQFNNNNNNTHHHHHHHAHPGPTSDNGSMVQQQSSSSNSPPKKNKINVSVSRTGRFVTPSPSPSHRHNINTNNNNTANYTTGGSHYQNAAPTLSPATEQTVALRVQALLADSHKSLAQHRDIMSALSTWEGDRSHHSSLD